MKKKHGSDSESKTDTKQHFKDSVTSPMGLDWDPDEYLVRERQLDKDARKFRLRKDNQTDRLILENFDTNVEDFIARYRKGNTIVNFQASIKFICEACARRSKRRRKSCMCHC